MENAADVLPRCVCACTCRLWVSIHVFFPSILIFFTIWTRPVKATRQQNIFPKCWNRVCPWFQKCTSVINQQCCQRNWPHEHSPLHPSHILYSRHWQIALIEFCIGILITLCWARTQVSLPLITIARTLIFAPAALPASSVAQFLVPFSVNRQWFHIASGMCALLPAGEAYG